MEAPRNTYAIAYIFPSRWASGIYMIPYQMQSLDKLYSPKFIVQGIIFQDTDPHFVVLKPAFCKPITLYWNEKILDLGGYLLLIGSTNIPQKIKISLQ